MNDATLEEKPENGKEDLSFKVFFELMARRVSEILLVSSPYDAFILEEDGRLAERIIHEYSGLNLTRPPRLTWKSSAGDALDELAQKKYDLVLTMPRIDDMDPYAFGRTVKKTYPELPIFLLTHYAGQLLPHRPLHDSSPIERTFVWLGNTDLLLALIKNVEDRMNVAHDTRRALVRVIIVIEDSAFYRSSILPLLYKEIVLQTQAVMEESLNEAHRILRMRARPKILLAETYEEALGLYREYRPFALSVLSDVRFPFNGRMDDEAGFRLLSMIKEETPDLPLLVFSSEESNRMKANRIPAAFIHKNNPALHTEIRNFFKDYLGFGDFVFRMPDGTEVGRAQNLLAMERVLPTLPEESIYYHAAHDDFSTWLMARSEIQLASRLRPIKASDFSSRKAAIEYLIRYIKKMRRDRQRGVVVDFVAEEFDPETGFVKVGKGSLGGKARGLAFVWELLKQNPELDKKYPEIRITIPPLMVVATDGFDEFVAENDLKRFASSDHTDREIEEAFLAGRFPDRLKQVFDVFLEEIAYPLAVRSSSLFEDALYYPCAGVYHTYMLPNNHPDPAVRREQLIQAVKLVYASTYLETPKFFASRTGLRIEEEKMGVIVQRLTGNAYGGVFYPSVSGVAQSYNFYPISFMKPADGIAHIALGLGKTVVEGESAIRFCPKHPQRIPQFSTPEEILANAQRFFYALKLRDGQNHRPFSPKCTLVQMEIDTARDHPPVQRLTSAYFPEDQRIRDSFQNDGYPVLTYSGLLKYRQWPLPEILSDMLVLGRRGLGCPAEIEFALDLPKGPGVEAEFALLQLRPMAMSRIGGEIEILRDDIASAVCFSQNAMGSGLYEDISDILFVRPDAFDPARTVEMAEEIRKINGRLIQQGRKYLLIGPGRWGSADRWLGIPVRWRDIAGVGAIIETSVQNLKADPSQGSHFFHNIVSVGIPYITVREDEEGFIDWQWLQSLPIEQETGFIRHVRLQRPLIVKIDGRNSQAVIRAGAME
ncbi:MAG: phosphoenolpyruvate synthase PpsA [Desulfobacteraceae bacterium]|nr:MAG: phosphoenolpyruvate synthase PpsA [Desulfobacteraceae bacterium]